MNLIWKRSRKGNVWTKLPGAQGPTCTIFRTRDREAPEALKTWGFKWCITRSAKEGPLFSEAVFPTVELAQKACVEKLSSLEAHNAATVDEG